MTADDPRDDKFERVARESTQQFLDGHLSPEEERHAMNVGRVCLEFACLEEAIGELAVTLNQVRGGSKAYMALVTTGRGVKKAIKELAAADSRWLNLMTDYERFKSDRDRYAHASVGTVIEERASSDGGRPIIHILTGRQKHPKGDKHHPGQISELPSDQDTDDLIKEMRKLRLGLLTARTTATVNRALSNLMPDFESMTRRLVHSALGNISRSLRGGDR